MIWDEKSHGTRESTPGTVCVEIGNTESWRNTIHLYTDVNGFNGLISAWHYARGVKPGSNLDQETLTVMRDNGEYLVTFWSNVKILRYLLNSRQG